MPKAFFCRDGRHLFIGVPVGGRCPEHAAAHLARDQARRMAKEQRRIWDSGRWRRFRARIRKERGDRCVDCGRHASELGPNERMLVDHRRGLATILAEGGDPFAEVEVELRCSTDSGRRDGARASRGS